MICNSGGAIGADHFFGQNCSKKGIKVIDWSFEGHNTKSPFRKNLNQLELDEGFEQAKAGCIAVGSPGRR